MAVGELVELHGLELPALRVYADVGGTLMRREPDGRRSVQDHLAGENRVNFVVGQAFQCGRRQSDDVARTRLAETVRDADQPEVEIAEIRV